MKVSLNWLKEFVSIDVPAVTLADALTMAGLEVESVAERYAYLDSVLVGRITAVDKHPNADKLSICEVDLGDRTLSVVCGAPNVREGMSAPLALPGTRFPNDVVLERGVIRGVASEGMLCSEAELALGPDAAGIMPLKGNPEPGQKLARALNLSDTVIEIDLTPNRPDCLSIIGTAREIAAIYKQTLQYKALQIEDHGDDISKHSSVTVKSPDLCPRYAARLIENVTVASSPFWLQDRLLAVGLRPINNIVDITNFVLMEQGQPLHAFDFDRLGEHRIVVRTAVDGECFTTLDEKERVLSKDMLLICDGEKPVAIAGVMGGLNSEIETDTTRVLLESAYFNPASIRKTSKRLGLNTDASHRFERGIDPQGTITALDRAAHLIADLGGGKIVNGLIDECARIPVPPTIQLSTWETNRLLGKQFSRDEIRDLLTSIEFEVSVDQDDTLTVKPPSFRVDVQRPEDLMEEVARLSGYQNIPTTLPLIAANTEIPLKRIDAREKIKTIMTGFGFTEAINYSFMDKSDCDLLRLKPDDPRRNLVEILNPLTEDQAVMRSSIIPGLLKSIRRNFTQQLRDGKLFEIGKVFINKGQKSLPEEIEILGGIWTGNRQEIRWNSKEMPCDFYDMKGVVEGLFASLLLDGIDYISISEELADYVRSGFTARILMNGELLGLVGELHPKVCRHYDLMQTAFIFELDLNRLYDMISETKQAEPIPKFPATSRDATVIIDKNIEAGRLLDFIEGMNEELVEQIYIFDIFTGGPIPDGKKSISFRTVYRSSQKTLDDDTVNVLHKNISERLVKKFKASLP